MNWCRFFHHIGQYPSCEACFVTKCVKKLLTTHNRQFSPTFALTFVVHRQAFRKYRFYQPNCKLMKIGKECQKMRNICCFLGTNFLLYIYLIVYMPCLPDATLSSNGNVPGIRVRKKLSYMISAKNWVLVQISSKKNVLNFRDFLVHQVSAISQNWV